MSKQSEKTYKIYKESKKVGANGTAFEVDIINIETPNKKDTTELYNKFK